MLSTSKMCASVPSQSKKTTDITRKVFFEKNIVTFTCSDNETTL